MTYGSATVAEQVPEYLNRIYKGKASAATIQDFENRYRLIGRSPLIDLTEKQAKLLEEKLGDNYVVRAGMRHSAPFISDAIASCKAEGATSLLGIILSPQLASFITKGYETAFMEAAQATGLSERASIAGSWPIEAHFIELTAERITQAFKEHDHAMPVIFTTHSMPQRVVESDPKYLHQLQATIDAVRGRLDSKLEWYAGYQSAGHTPEAWLKPDLVDILADLHKKKTDAVLIVPIQFLTDHLEILYDLDIAARKQCEEYGIAYKRIELPNTDPLFIEALAANVS
jgi:ferrochelatase